jgi:hypothetical protein
MGQFIVAILCGSFDETREAQSAQEEVDKPPTGYVLIQPVWCTWHHFIFQLFTWNFSICGLSADDLLATMDTVGGSDASTFLTVRTLAKRKC